MHVVTDHNGQVIIAGTGESHLEIVIDRLKREFNVEAKNAKPVLLEPVMRVEVDGLKEHMGDVMGNLSSRRGQIQSQEDRAARR